MVFKDKRKYSERREYLISAVAKRRKQLKQDAVFYKGGKCQICGYNKCVAALEFHHVEPSKKKFGIAAGGITRSWKTVKKELDKCVMVCANCHREITEGIVSLPEDIKYK